MDDTTQNEAVRGFPWKRVVGWAALLGVVLTGTTWLVARLLGVEASFQTVSDRTTEWLPPEVFAFIVFRLQHWAKPLLLLGLVSAWIVLGATVALVAWRLAWERAAGAGGKSWLGGLSAGLALLIVPVAVVSPIAGLGFAGSGAAGGALRWSAAALLPALLYGWLVYTQRPRRRTGVSPTVVAADEARVIRPQTMIKELDRRGFLRLAGVGTVAAAGFALMARDALHLARGTAAVAGGVGQAAADAEGWSSAVTPVGKFYVVSKNFMDPGVNVARWRLNVHGLVDNPAQFTYDDILAMPSKTQYQTLACISNRVGGDQISNGLWKGVPVHTLLERAGVQSGAGFVLSKSADGYSESLPLDAAMAPEVILAYEMNGAPLVKGHGFPLRLLIPGRYGMKGPKWLDDIELSAEDREGYWERRGWDQDAIVKTTSRVDVPKNGAMLAMGAVTIAGIAFAGKRGVQAVEVSTDDGATWRPAMLEPALSEYSWVRWVLAWDPPTAGTYRLLVRATDLSGEVQTGVETDDYPSGATGYHGAMITVV